MKIIDAQQIILLFCFIFSGIVWFKLFRAREKIDIVYNSPRKIWAMLDTIGRAALIFAIIFFSAGVTLFFA